MNKTNVQIKSHLLNVVIVVKRQFDRSFAIMIFTLSFVHGMLIVLQKHTSNLLLSL